MKLKKKKQNKTKKIQKQKRLPKPIHFIFIIMAYFLTIGSSGWPAGIRPYTGLIRKEQCYLGCANVPKV